MFKRSFVAAALGAALSVVGPVSEAVAGGHLFHHHGCCYSSQTSSFAAPAAAGAYMLSVPAMGNQYQSYSLAAPQALSYSVPQVSMQAYSLASQPAPRSRRSNMPSCRWVAPRRPSRWGATRSPSSASATWRPSSTSSESSEAPSAEAGRAGGSTISSDRSPVAARRPRHGRPDRGEGDDLPGGRFVLDLEFDRGRRPDRNVELLRRLRDLGVIQQAAPSAVRASPALALPSSQAAVTAPIENPNLPAADPVAAELRKISDRLDALEKDLQAVKSKVGLAPGGTQ